VSGVAADGEVPGVLIGSSVSWFRPIRGAGRDGGSESPGKPLKE